MIFSLSSIIYMYVIVICNYSVWLIDFSTNSIKNLNNMGTKQSQPKQAKSNDKVS